MMNLRQMIRRWLRWLADEPSQPLTRAVALALPADTTVTVRWPVIVSLETLYERATVTPDRRAYELPFLYDVEAVMRWMVYGRSGAWWLVPTHDAYETAVTWLGIRERVVGQKAFG